jgi:hypothetical protein
MAASSAGRAPVVDVVGGSQANMRCALPKLARTTDFAS